MGYELLSSHDMRDMNILKIYLDYKFGENNYNDFLTWFKSQNEVSENMLKSYFRKDKINQILNGG